MVFIYYFSVISLLIVIIGGIVGLVKPSLLRKVIGKFATRKSIALLLFAGFFFFGTLLTTTEPESVKQARLDKEKASQTAKLEDESKKKAELRASEEAKQKELEKQKYVDPRYYWHEVIEVVDGDTVKARVDNKVESIRIIGINSPESTNTTECFGKEASAKAKEFLNGKWIQLEADSSQSNRDKYNRLLRYVWFDNGTDFGRRMIEEGYAQEYTYDVPYLKQSQYKETQKQSQAKNIGLWSPETCSGQAVKPAPKPAATTQPRAATPTPKPAPSSSNCDPNYAGGCVPNVSYDLDCGDISFSVRVIGTDKHRFDRDGDGIGCESN